MSVFIKNGHFCFVQKNPNEISECYIHRGFSIVSKIPTTQQEFDRYELLSNYLGNIKFLGCSYTKKINEDCKNMDENLMKN